MDSGGIGAAIGENEGKTRSVKHPPLTQSAKEVRLEDPVSSISSTTALFPERSSSRTTPKLQPTLAGMVFTFRVLLCRVLGGGVANKEMVRNKGGGMRYQEYNVKLGCRKRNEK